MKDAIGVIMNVRFLVVGLLFYANANGMCGAGGPGKQPTSPVVATPFGIERPSSCISSIAFRCASKDDLITIINTKTKQITHVQASRPAGVTQIGFYARQFEFGPRSDPSETIIPADSIRKIAEINWNGPKGRPNLVICDDLKCRVEQVAWKNLVSKVPEIYLSISTSPLASAIVDEKYMIYRIGNSEHSKHSLSGQLTNAKDGSKVGFCLKPATDSDFPRKLD